MFAQSDRFVGVGGLEQVEGLDGRVGRNRSRGSVGSW